MPPVTATYGPTDRHPDFARNEYQYGRLESEGTEVIVPNGGGRVHTVAVGVAGTLLILHDVESGGATSDATEIATVSLAAAGNVTLDVAFSKGLTAIVTGAASDITISFGTRHMLSPRTFPNR